MLARHSAETPSTAKIGLDKRPEIWYNTPMQDDPPDDIVDCTYPYAYGYCLGYLSVLLDRSEQIMLDSKSIDKPNDLRKSIHHLHALIRNTHNKLNQLKVKN